MHYRLLLYKNPVSYFILNRLVKSWLPDCIFGRWVVRCYGLPQAYDSDKLDKILRDIWGIQLIAPHKKIEGPKQRRMVVHFDDTSGDGRSKGCLRGYRITAG